MNEPVISKSDRLEDSCVFCLKDLNGELLTIGRLGKAMCRVCWMNLLLAAPLAGQEKNMRRALQSEKVCKHKPYLAHDDATYCLDCHERLSPVVK